MKQKKNKKQVSSEDKARAAVAFWETAWIAEALGLYKPPLKDDEAKRVARYIEKFGKTDK